MAEKEKNVAEVATKSAKPKKEKKKGKTAGFWKGFKSELKKIVWTPWNQVKKNTFVVLVIIIAAAIVIGALDLLFSKGILALGKIF